MPTELGLPTCGDLIIDGDGYIWDASWQDPNDGHIYQTSYFFEDYTRKEMIEHFIWTFVKYSKERRQRIAERYSSRN